MDRELLARFSPITLDELGASSLLDRLDRKFVVPRTQLDAVLAACQRDFRVLEVNGQRVSRYATRYFDTSDLALYHAHHAGRPARAKVRVREYVDSGSAYIELKRRSSGGRVRKSRVAVAGDTLAAFHALEALPEYRDARVATVAALGPVVDVRYARITLVRSDGTERVTLDLDVAISDGAREVLFPSLIFAELKQAERADSPFAVAMRALHVRETSVSKYCLGVVSLVEHARKNRFKPMLSRLPHELRAAPADSPTRLPDCA